MCIPYTLMQGPQTLKNLGVVVCVCNTNSGALEGSESLELTGQAAEPNEKVSRKLRYSFFKDKVETNYHYRPFISN